MEFGQFYGSPVSKSPIVVSVPEADESGEVGVELVLELVSRSVWYCKKSHDRVVCSCKTGSTKTDTTPDFPAMAAASFFDKRAANPEKPCL